jgi:putative ABC transport system ATP-binding protein
MARTSIAYIGQEPFLGDGTVEDALLLPFNFKANSMHRPSRSTLIDTLELIGLPDAILSSTTDTISGGEKQRIAVARSLLLNKSVFCIDEVTSALDLDSAEKITSLFRNKPATILSVSHDSRWFNIADRYIEINNGTVNSNTTDRSKVQI